MELPSSFRIPAEVRPFMVEALAENPKRVEHVLEIARRVRNSGEKLRFSGELLDLAESAALLHDIGYWKEIALTGFHPIDGAKFLIEHGEREIADLIVGHSCSPEEGQLLGHLGIEQSPNIVAKLITFWDVQVKQGGEVVTYSERYNDILKRYGEDSIVGQANKLAKSRIELIIDEVSRLLS